MTDKRLRSIILDAVLAYELGQRYEHVFTTYANRETGKDKRLLLSLASYTEKQIDSLSSMLITTR